VTALRSVGSHRGQAIDQVGPAVLEGAAGRGSQELLETAQGAASRIAERFSGEAVAVPGAPLCSSKGVSRQQEDTSGRSAVSVAVSCLSDEHIQLQHRVGRAMTGIRTWLGNNKSWHGRHLNLMNCRRPSRAGMGPFANWYRCSAGHISMGPNPRCGLRWCPECSVTEGLRKRDAILAALKVLNPDLLKIITLSTQSDHDLRVASARLLKAWKRFVRSAEYKQHVSGCIWIWETTWSRDSGWHPHLHLIVESSFWAKRSMSDLWVRCTDGAAHPAPQWIQKLETPRIWSKYVSTKYLSKGLMSLVDTLPIERLSELIEYTWGMRTLRTYGKCYGIKIPEDDQPGTIACSHRGCELRAHYLRSAAEQIKAQLVWNEQQRGPPGELRLTPNGNGRHGR